MKVVILNWKDGENDPFSVMNDALKAHLQACGKNVEILEIYDTDWIDRIVAMMPEGVEYVLTWQGFASFINIPDTEQNLWDVLRIPLVCLHGDHPSHMPMNHRLESRYCYHIYLDAEFARYSNAHFRRVRGAMAISWPQIFRETPLSKIEGDFFVIAKNIDDPVDTENGWKQRLPKNVFDAFMATGETLRSQLKQPSYVDTHAVLDALIKDRDWDWFDPVSNSDVYHYVHSQMDLYARNYKSILALTSIPEFPVRVYGRGWDRIAKNASSNHVFHPGRNMSDSQPLFYSRYGLIDISPAKVLHDRTLRAMANRTAFISNASLEADFFGLDRYDGLFYSPGAQDLAEKCAEIVDAPEVHLELARDFAERYQDRFHVKGFANQLDLLVNSARFLEAGA